MKVFLITLLAQSVLCAHIKYSERIVGGRDLLDREFPYQISLKLEGVHWCGGSIINPTFILTSAHCVDDLDVASMTVHVATNQNDTYIFYDVVELRIHENYSAVEMKNDIAILKLKSPIAYNSKVQPVELETEFTPGDVDSILSGWGTSVLNGSTPNLQYINTVTVELDDCRSLIPAAHVDESQICAFTVKDGCACHSDSGGPLVANHKQIGILSFRNPCAKGQPDVYTRVSYFIDWIKEYGH